MREAVTKSEERGGAPWWSPPKGPEALGGAMLEDTHHQTPSNTILLPMAKPRPEQRKQE